MLKTQYVSGDGWYFVGDDGGCVLRVVMWQITEGDKGPEITALTSVCDKGIPRVAPAPGVGRYKHQDELTEGERRQAAKG